MVDFLEPEVRSRIMSRIGSKDTKPELTLRRGLWAAGIRGWRCHRKGLPGKPDLSFGPTKVAVFVDGGFWHGHPDHFTSGKSGEYWDSKIRRNQERDKLADQALIDLGWTVLRFWDFEVNADVAACVEAVATELGRSRKSLPRKNRLNWDGKTL